MTWDQRLGGRGPPGFSVTPVGDLEGSLRKGPLHVWRTLPAGLDAYRIEAEATWRMLNESAHHPGGKNLSFPGQYLP